MSETPRTSLIESAEPAYDRLHTLAEEEQALEQVHAELHAEWEEAQAAEVHAQKQIKMLCDAIANRQVDSKRALAHIEVLHRIIEMRKVQMEKLKQDLVDLRKLENDLEMELRDAALLILPEAQA